MKKFSIKVISKEPEEVDDLPCYWGKIVIGKFKYDFVMSVDSWSLQDYKRQWKNGLERIKTHDTSCILEDIRNIKKQPSSEFWGLYKVGTTIFFMHHIEGGKIFKKIAKGAMPPYYFDSCYELISPRVVNEKGNAINHEGYKLVEHAVDLADITGFLETYRIK